MGQRASGAVRQRQQRQQELVLELETDKGARAAACGAKPGGQRPRFRQCDTQYWRASVSVLTDESQLWCQHVLSSSCHRPRISRPASNRKIISNKKQHMASMARAMSARRPPPATTATTHLTPIRFMLLRAMRDVLLRTGPWQAHQRQHNFVILEAPWYNSISYRADGAQSQAFLKSLNQSRGRSKNR